VSRHHVVMLVSALLAAASAAGAQSMPNINAPKQAAQRAVAAENAQLSAQTGQAIPTRSGPPAPAAAPAPAPAPRQAGAPSKPAPIALVAAPQVTREIFAYADGGRRDPFFSLILTEDLRPLLSDIKLVGVLYEPSGRRSVAIFRDVVTNAQYRVQTGMPLGRMRVAQIKPKGVIFTIDEFGLSRQDSLMLADSLKARIR
jgi:type II secretory pathway pseudopilin PulG